MVRTFSPLVALAAVVAAAARCAAFGSPPGRRVVTPRARGGLDRGLPRSVVRQRRGPSTTMFLSQGGILGVGTPEVIVIACVGYFLLGPEELYKLSKEIGKLVAQVRAYVTASADEWRSTMDESFEFKEVQEIQAAAQELSEAFNFRSSRYANDLNNFNTGSDDQTMPEAPSTSIFDESAAASAAESADSFSAPGAGATDDMADWRTASSPQLDDADSWNASILAREAAAKADAPPKDARLAELDRLYEAKRRALELEFGYERDKLEITMEDAA